MRYRTDNRVALENDAVRLDIVEKVCGSARYSTDYYLPAMLWAAYIRSDFGDARLRSANEEAARAAPGVLEVVIERRTGRYHGDRIGHICAESGQALDDGLSAL
jgi:CO/xanthine dehydrogenase Mo-binding subunit